MEKNKQSDTVRFCRLLYFVNYFGIENNFNFLAVSKLIVKNAYNCFLPLRTSNIDCFLFLIVSHVPIRAFKQHPFNNLFVSALDCKHERSPSIIILCVFVKLILWQAEQICGYSDKTGIRCFMKKGVADVIWTVWVKGNFSIPTLKKINDAFEVIAFEGHEEYILIFMTSCLHVGTISLKKLNHFEFL